MPVGGGIGPGVATGTGTGVGAGVGVTVGAGVGVGAGLGDADGVGVGVCVGEGVAEGVSDGAGDETGGGGGGAPGPGRTACRTTEVPSAALSVTVKTAANSAGTDRFRGVGIGARWIAMLPASAAGLGRTTADHRASRSDNPPSAASAV